MPKSFHRAIRNRGIAAAERAEHTVDLLDLVAEDFDPVLRAEERRRYHDLQHNRVGLDA